MRLLASVLFLYACGVSILYWSLVRALRKKNAEAKKVMQGLTNGDLSLRVVTPHASKGVEALSSTINELLQHLELVINRVVESEQKKVRLVEELGHDLRTPMTAISVELESLRDYFNSMPVEKREQSLSRAIDEVKYMQRLIEFLFVIARVGLPDYQVNFNQLDLKRLIEKEISSRKGGAENSLNWSVDWGGLEALSIEGDRSLIVRLIRNLLDNSEKFAKREISITWRVLGETLEDGKGNECFGVLSIKDDGPGMDEKTLGQFGKVKMTKVEISDIFKTGRSLGIGSSIVKAISNLHGWKMEIVSVRDALSSKSGTTISFEIKYLRSKSTPSSEAA